MSGRKYISKKQVEARLRDLTRDVNYFGKNYVDYKKVAGPYKPRKGVFESTHYLFNPLSLESTSYGWWHMLKLFEVGGRKILVRNAYYYSQETGRDQNKLNKALRALGIKPDLELHVRASILREEDVTTELLRNYVGALIKFKYCQNKSGMYYMNQIDLRKRELKKLVRLGYKSVSQEEVNVELGRQEELRKTRLQVKRESRRFRERTR